MSNEINKRIAYYRKKAGYKQIEVADILGIKRSTYSQRERLGDIEAEFLKDLAELFKVDIKVLLYGEEKETPSKEEIILPPNFITVAINNREVEIIKIWRNLSAVKKNMFFKFGYDLLMNRKKPL